MLVASSSFDTVDTVVASVVSSAFTDDEAITAPTVNTREQPNREMFPFFNHSPILLFCIFSIKIHLMISFYYIVVCMALQLYYKWREKSTKMLLLFTYGKSHQISFLLRLFSLKI